MTRGAAEAVLGLKDGVADELAGVLVGETVEDPRPVLTGGHDSGQAELRQMLRNRRRGLVENVGEVIHRQLLAPQRQDDPNPGRISEHAEDFDGEFHVLAIGASSALLFNCIHTQIVTHSLSFAHAQRRL